RVLVRTEHVLEVLCALDELLRSLADLGRRELGRVTGALAGDPRAMEVLVARVGVEPVCALPQAGELAAGQLPQRDLPGLNARPPGRGLELVEQREVAVARERVHSECLCRLPFCG